MRKANSDRSISGCGRSLAVGLCLLLSILVFLRIASAQDDEIAPNANLEIIGIPKIPASLALQVKRYSGVYGLPLAGWDVVKRAVWLKGLSSVTWLTRIESPGSEPKMWIYMRESGVYDIYFQPQSKYFLFNKDTNGDEAFQMYLYDVAARKSNLISDGKSRSTEPVNVDSRACGKKRSTFRPLVSRRTVGFCPALNAS